MTNALSTSTASPTRQSACACGSMPLLNFAPPDTYLAVLEFQGVALRLLPIYPPALRGQLDRFRCR